MKTKLLVSIQVCALALAFGAVAAVLTGRAFAADFSGPERVSTNRKLAPTDYHFVAWYDPDQREWLRVQGKDDAKTITEQWGPRSVTIESSREPQVARTATGWIIVFK